MDQKIIYRTPSQFRPREMNGPNMLRAYRQSPEDVCLQLRLNKSFVSVSLLLAEARELGEYLIAAAQESVT